jgi:opacity protein-like surface antigen
VLGFYRYQSQTEGSIEGLSKGKLTTMPLSLGIQGRFPVNERLFPYLAAGVAYHFNTFKLCQICQDNWDALGFDVREEVENGLGFQFGAGLDYEVTDYIDLNLDVRYQIAQGSGSWSQTDQFSGAAVSGDLEGLNFNALIIRVGAKIFLKII